MSRYSHLLDGGRRQIAAMGDRVSASLPDAIRGPLAGACSGFGVDVIFAAAVLVVISILLFPLPRVLLDFGLSVSVVVSVLILLVSLFLETPAEFTSFPTILLLTTLLRLALEVATTRLILSYGYEGRLAAGHIVAAFGGLLMNGDVFIGIILFCILLVVNFMVITKGSGRIAEVAARFSLDALPGKQMAIDAELNSGAISDKEARRRRHALEEESAFFGTMDGAAKFVRGDAIAGLIIAVINIVGGLSIGVVRHHLAFSEALSTFTTLTIGDGLVAQIPALLVSTAAGIVVTKGAATGKIGQSVTKQIGNGTKPLALSSFIAAVFAFVPGMPFVIFILLAGVLGGAAYLASRRQQESVVADLPATPPPPRSKSEETVVAHVEPLRLDLGINLLAIVSGDTSRVTSQIQMLRQKIAEELGFILPSVRIQDNLRLGESEYCIRVRDIEAGRGTVSVNRLLVMDTQGGVPDMPGDVTKEPAFGLDAKWVDASHREAALVRGYTVVDPASVIVTHLAEVVKINIADLLLFGEAERLIATLPDDVKKLSNEIIPNQISMPTFHRVLQALVSEQVAIRDLSLILEALQEASALGLKQTTALTAHVRLRLCRQISHAAAGGGEAIPSIVLGARWEAACLNAAGASRDETTMALPPKEMGEFVEALRKALETAARQAIAPVVLVDGAIRLSVRSVVERVRPSVTVLSYAELHPRAKVKTIAALS